MSCAVRITELDAALQGRRLSANQLQFLDLVIDYLTARGVMDPSLLYESPFAGFGPRARCSGNFRNFNGLIDCDG